MKTKQIYEQLEREFLVIKVSCVLSELDIANQIDATHRVRASIIRKRLRDVIPEDCCECRLNSAFPVYYKEKNSNVHYTYAKKRNNKPMSPLISRRVYDMTNDKRRYCQN